MNKDKQTIIIQNQNIQNNNGCLKGLFVLFILGVILSIIEAFAPLIGILIGLTLGSWIGFKVGSDNESEKFREVIYKIKKTNWKKLNEVEDSTKRKFYYIAGFGIPLGVAGFFLGRGMFSS